MTNNEGDDKSMENDKEARIINVVLGTDYSDKAIGVFFGAQPEEVAAIRAETYENVLKDAGV